MTPAELQTPLKATQKPETYKYAGTIGVAPLATDLYDSNIQQLHSHTNPHTKQNPSTRSKVTIPSTRCFNQ